MAVQAFEGCLLRGLSFGFGARPLGAWPLKGGRAWDGASCLALEAT